MERLKCERCGVHTATMKIHLQSYDHPRARVNKHYCLCCGVGWLTAGDVSYERRDNTENFESLYQSHDATFMGWMTT